MILAWPPKHQAVKKTSTGTCFLLNTSLFLSENQVRNHCDGKTHRRDMQQGAEVTEETRP